MLDFFFSRLFLALNAWLVGVLYRTREGSMLDFSLGLLILFVCLSVCLSAVSPVRQGGSKCLITSWPLFLCLWPLWNQGRVETCLPDRFSLLACLCFRPKHPHIHPPPLVDTLCVSDCLCLCLSLSPCLSVCLSVCPSLSLSVTVCLSVSLSQIKSIFIIHQYTKHKNENCPLTHGLKT